MEPVTASGDREWQATQILSPQQKNHGIKFLKLAATLQYTLPGVPSIFYGDEGGVVGYSDPFCRACYPYGNENPELLEFYRLLGKLRRNCSAFAGGDFIPVFSEFGHIAYIRQNQNEAVLIAVNRWCNPQDVALPEGWENAEVIAGRGPQNSILSAPAEGIALLKKERT